MIRSAPIALLACLGACAAAPEAPQAPAAPMMTGAYGKADQSNDMVKAAQAVAVNEIYTRNPTRALVEKVDVEQQVVAGLNFRFDITMSGGSRFKVTVYRNLQGEHSVTSFEKVG